jgi:hypothetical protein
MSLFDMSQSNLEGIRPSTGSAQRRDKDAQRGESGWEGGRVLESHMAQRHSEPLLEVRHIQMWVLEDYLKKGLLILTACCVVW